MTTAFKGFLRQFWQPQHNSIRFRTKLNTKKPRPPHFTRAKVEQLCTPFYPRFRDPLVPVYELCQGPERKIEKIDYPYENILAKKVLNLFNQSRYILFFHINSMRAVELLEIKLVLKKCGIETHMYGKNLLQKALTGTIYESSLILFQSHTLIGCGEDVQLSELIKNLKRTQIILMAGIIDQTLLSITELQNFSKLPDIQTLRASFVSVLNSVAGNVVQQLNHHPSTLVQHLEQHVKISEEKKS